MGIVNPVLEKYVNWPWFIVSQVVYGLVMSFVVVNSEKVPVPPAGSGPNMSAGSLGPGEVGGHS
jgi:hypothetical protein